MDSRLLLVDQHRTKLIEQDDQRLVRWARQFQDILKSRDSKRLVQLVTELIAVAQQVRRGRLNLNKLSHYHVVLTYILEYLDQFTAFAQSSIIDERIKATLRATQDGQAILQAIRDTVIVPSPQTALNQALTMPSPLATLLYNTYGLAVNKINSSLMEGIEKGKNPRDVAKQLTDDLHASFFAMDRIARTEMLRAYRESQRRYYEDTGLLRGYQRLATKDHRVCLACLVNDGRFYAIDQRFIEHPQGRCQLVPVFNDEPDLEWQFGHQWIHTIPQQWQQEIMGKDRWELYKKGIALDTMIETVNNGIWGLGYRTIPLNELQKRYAT